MINNDLQNSYKTDIENICKENNIYIRFDLIKNCKSTIKNGIKFTNWSKNNGSYFHPFSSTNSASNDYKGCCENV